MKNAQIQNRHEVIHIKVNPARTKLKLEIVFGSLSASCKGSGICKVVPFGIQTEDWKCPHASAWVYITTEARLRIEFIKHSMFQQYIRRYFRWHLFQVQEAFEMPLFVEKRLKVSEKIIVRPGVYSVKETAQKLIVDF